MAEGGTKPKKHHAARNVGLGILIILILGGVLFYFLFLGSGEANIAFQAASNSSAVKSLILKQINSTPMVGVGYTGMITTNATNAQGIDPQVTLPFTATYLKYYNNTRVQISFAGNPQAGLSNLSAVGISLDNGSTVYICYNINNAGYSCKRATGSPFQIVKNLSSAFSLTGVSGFSIQKFSPSFYNLMPCWQAQGSFNVTGSSNLLNGNTHIQFSTCVSSSSYFPLYLDANITPQAGSPTLISVKVTNLTMATSLAQVSTLPGPVR